MNKINKTYRFLTFCLIFLVFLSSVGFTVDMHFCSNELKSISFIGKAKPCHEHSLNQCPFHKKMMKQSADGSKVAKNCCENKTFHFQSDQDQQIQTFDFQITQPAQLFLAVYVELFFTNSSNNKDIIAFTRYKPPIIPRDILVLIQSFLL